MTRRTAILEPHRTSGSTLTLLQDARGDLRYAVRLFARQPTVLLLAIIGLSLGLGIATSAFSIMNAARRGDGLADPDRAPGVLRTTDRSLSTAWTYDEFVRLRAGATRMQVEAVLTETAAVRIGPSEAAAPSVGVALVSGGFFAATGGRTTLGRSLAADDESALGSPPVVVSFIFWTTTLNRDPSAIGRTIRIGRTDATIVGVAERGFTVPSNRLLWMPMTAYGAVYATASARRAPDTGIQVFGRLLPGVAIAEAEAQLSGVASGLPRGPAESALRVRLDPHAGLGRISSADAIGIVVFVFAVIVLVLLLACANVATVLVATAIAREREMGVRAALGADRWRIVRQLVTESVTLGTIAAAVGLALAYATIPAIGTMIEAPAGVDLAPDVNVYLFLALVTLVTGIGAGLAPAAHVRSIDLVTPLKGDGARRDRIGPRRLRSILVATQAAVSLALIVVATLFVRAAVRASTIDAGFDARGLYTISLGSGEHSWMRAIDELGAVSGVRSLSLVELPPFGGGARISIAGEGPTEVRTYFNRTGAEYLDTLGLRILAGRMFTRDEVATRAPVAVVSQSLARAYWRGESPLGQMLPPAIKIPEIPELPRPMVIGVVTDAIAARLHERSTFAVYQPLDPAAESSAELMIRIAPGTTGVIEEVGRRLRAIDPQADVRVASIAERLEQEASRPRLLAIVTGMVGVIAIVLCVIGLYGLTASVVGQRTHEMGVRVAMGAAPRDLLRLLMWDSAQPVIIGLALGAVAALLASRIVVAALFFGVSPRDPIAYVGATGILLAAVVLAVLVPTRRAAAVDAASILRRS